MTHAMHAQHTAQANALANPNDATHVAVNDGDWSDPGTWATGRVPGSEAKVLIRDGVSVTYDMDSNVALKTVRVDGDLTWSTDQNTHMRVETIVTSHGSKITIGSADNPIPANIDALITFRDTPINTQQDPGQLSHGLVTFGEVDIYGATKESHLTLDGDVNRGDRSIDVDGNLNNWEIGDTILLVGTGSGSRDEERTITGINGDTITFDRALNYNHKAPDGLDVDTYVGNLSRSVTFESENPDGVRAHVMMHNNMPGADGTINDVMYAAFNDMGRTDSSIVTGTAGNPLGRYPIHLHQVGTDADAIASQIIGNAVNGSVGWGITQHESHAMVNHNIVYDTVGAGIVSETGNETGMWIGNLVSSVDGEPVKKDGALHPIAGSEGAAYENQSRVIIQQDNIAANARIGWNYSGREDFEHPSTQDGAHREMFTRDQVPFDPSPFDVALDHEEPPLVDFNGNQVIASSVGLRVFHRQYSDDTDTMSVLRNFDVWGGSNGVHLANYASNYAFYDSVWQGTGTGFRIDRKTSSAVIKDVEIRDFDTGYQSYGNNHEVVLIDAEFRNVGERFDLADLLRNIKDSGTANELVNYWRQNHGIDYRNPMPDQVNSNSLREVERVTFKLDPGADMTIGPKGDRDLKFTGIITDSVGDRRFNEYAIANPPNGRGSSKNFEGIDISFGRVSQGRELEFTQIEFVELHGAFQKPDGSWVSPVVNWVTERLSGDQHPVIIEVKLEGFDNSFLQANKLDAYPNPSINNVEFFEAANAPRSGPQESHDGHGAGMDHGHDDHSDDGMPDMPHDDASHGHDSHDHGVTAPMIREASAPATASRRDHADDHDSNLDPIMVPGQGSQAPTHDGHGDLRAVTGNDGKNRLTTNDEDSFLRGLGSEDRIYGGSGDDVLEGGAGRDNLYGGRGADTFAYGADAIDDGIDDIHDFNIAEGDKLDLTDVAETFGMSGADFVDALSFTQLQRGLRVEVEVDGVTHKLAVIRDMDEATFTAAAPWIVDAVAAPMAHGHAQNHSHVHEGPMLDPDHPEYDPLDGVARHEAPAQAPAVEASAASGALTGDARNNTLTDGAADSVISGLAGRDRLAGGAGDDVIDGGADKDWLTGGDGSDTFVFGVDGLDGYRDDITDFNAAEGDKIDLSQIAAVHNLSEDQVELTDLKAGVRIRVEIEGEMQAIAIVRNTEVADIIEADALLM